uniref:WWE domain-containing protein n=1 Tax=Heterorhabditis bacteriophora TaxID=37862 RepID=A0A1I7WL75_HETBA
MSWSWNREPSGLWCGDSRIFYSMEEKTWIVFDDEYYIRDLGLMRID